MTNSVDLTPLTEAVNRVNSAFASPALQSSLRSIFDNATAAMNKFAIAIASIDPPEEFSTEDKVIGNTTCVFNARSTELRCAINPCGPCEECQHYEE